MSQEKFQLVQRLVIAFNARDADAASVVLADDAEWRPAYTGGGAVEGTVYRGHEGFRRYLDDLAETWREIEGYIDDLREVENHVLLTARIRFVARASGVEMTQPITGVFTFRDDKIATARYYLDRAKALEAVGLSE